MWQILPVNTDIIIDTVNGVKIRSLCHLVQVLESINSESETISVEVVSPEGFTRSFGLYVYPAGSENLKKLRKLGIDKTRSGGFPQTRSVIRS